MRQIEEIRNDINKLDDELLRLYLRRLELSKEVAEFKIANNLPVLNSSREQYIIDRMCEGLDEEMSGYVRELYLKIFELSRKRQEILIKERENG